MSGYNRAFRNMLNHIVGIIVLIILTGCAMKSEAEKFPVQGDDEYGIDFNLPSPNLVEDWSIWRYSYAPWDGDRPLGRGGRCCYDEYYTLILDFGFKDGRRFHEEIDIEELMRELSSRETIFDNRKTESGGGATVKVIFSETELIIDYVVTDRYWKENPRMLLSNDYRYSLFRKSLK